MSEKASCPRCGSHVSEVYYDSRHEWCGWNCEVEYVVAAYGSLGDAEATVSVKPPQDFRDQIATLVQADEATVTVRVNGGEVRGTMSAWLDPDADSPEPVPTRGEKNLRELKKKRLLDARNAIDRELGEIE